ncbi:MAG TPA: DUF1080 domain-containing protein [Chryseosolibacter sp.]
MRITLSALILTLIVSFDSNAAIFADTTKLEGRWDLTLIVDGKESPSWLEVTHSGHKTLVGHFVGVVGSARPVSEIKVDGNKFSFAIPPQWESGENDMKVEGTWTGKQLTGTVVFPDGKSCSFKGVRAPALRRKEGTPGKPVNLIQKTGTAGWEAMGPNQWVVENGILKSPKSGSNLVTTEKFNDFKLHVEFRYPKGSNSGIYLRGRYEVQVMDSQGNDPVPGEFGGVYGFIAPSEQVAKAAGEWQTYDITLVGRMITVVANGKTIISNQEIPGITGGALDSKEGEPGPLMLQGDHGPVEYRNIVITPLK